MCSYIIIPGMKMDMCIIYWFIYGHSLSSWRVWTGRSAGRHSAGEKGMCFICFFFFSYHETSIIITSSLRANACVHSCFASSVIFMFVVGSTGRRRF